MDLFFLLVFLAIVAAAVVIRRKVNEPANPFGRWYDRHVRPWFSLGLKVVMFLTVIIWFAVYLMAPEKDRSSLGDLIDRFNHPEGKAPVGKDKTGKTGPEMSPPVRR